MNAIKIKQRQEFRMNFTTVVKAKVVHPASSV